MKVAAATARELNVLGTLDYSLQCNAHPGCVALDQCAPAVTAFANFATAAAAHLPKVTRWEIWNESNLSQFWSPSPNASDSVKFLNADYAAIKNAAPNDVVIIRAPSQKKDKGGATDNFVPHSQRIAIHTL